MNNELQEIYDYYLELDQDERLIKVKEAISNLSKSNDIYAHFMDPTAFSKYVFILFIGADRKITKRELNIFNDIFDEDYSLNEFAIYAQEALKKYNLEKLDEIVDKLSAEEKNDVCIIGLSLISDDEEISEHEQEVFEIILKNR